MKRIGLYIHIPFCQRKCFYCDFISYTDFDHDIVVRYFNLLKKELLIYKSEYDFVVDSIYIGGGTPSVVDERFIIDLLQFIFGVFNVSDNCEISIEANPESLNRHKIMNYKSSGINRISIGVQSLNQTELDLLGRIHSSKKAKMVIDEVSNYFDNFNVDIMIGIPKQTISSFKKTIDWILSYDVKHISVYSLKIEKNTKFYQKLNEIKKIVPSDDEERELYYLAIDKLKDKGIYQYEISNFSKIGYECIHNLKYWNYEDYLGVGCAAHSFLNFTRFNNTNDLQEYIKELEDDKKPIINIEHIPYEERIKEYIILGLRKSEGIDLSTFRKIFNVDLVSIYNDRLEKLKKYELIEIDSVLRLTKKGMDFANMVWREFL